MSSSQTVPHVVSKDHTAYTFRGKEPKKTDCEDGDSMIFQNGSDYLPQDTASYSEGYNLALIAMWVSKVKSWLKQLLASCHEGPGTLGGQYRWQTDWQHFERFSSEYFGFPLSVSFHIHLIIHH